MEALMFFGYIQLVKSLTRQQHLVIFLTTFVTQISVELVQGDWRQLKAADISVTLPDEAAGAARVIVVDHS